MINALVHLDFTPEAAHAFVALLNKNEIRDALGHLITFSLDQTTTNYWTITETVWTDK